MTVHRSISLAPPTVAHLSRQPHFATTQEAKEINHPATRPPSQRRDHVRASDHPWISLAPPTVASEPPAARSRTTPVAKEIDSSSRPRPPSAEEVRQCPNRAERATYADPVLTFLRPGFAPHAVPYDVAWAEQRRLHGQRVAGLIEDVCLLLEHPSVYTAGRRTEPHERPLDGTPVVEVDRGGKITWHGPGQLVGYPIIQLPSGVYVVDYVRRIEAALIEVCADLGVTAIRVKGRSGVWTVDGQRKLAAIGIRVSRGVTMHGFALNADCDLAPYHRIVPCGITDAGVSTLSLETGRQVTVAETVEAVERRLPSALETPVGRALAPIAR
jgi:lipoyl(octanoyl) transferase